MREAFPEHHHEFLDRSNFIMFLLFPVVVLTVPLVL